MSGSNLFHFIVVKPIVWAATHIFGHHVEDQVTADVQALEPKIQSALASLLGVKIAGIITSTAITLAQVNTAIIPEADTLIAQAIASVGAPPEYTSKLTTWAEAILPDLIAELYNGAVSTPAAAPAAVAHAEIAAVPQDSSSMAAPPVTPAPASDEKDDDEPNAAMELVAPSDADTPG